MKGWENYSKCCHLIQVFGFYTSFLLVFKWRLEHTMKKFNNSCFILAVWTGWVFSCSIIEFHPSKLQLNSNQQFYIDSTWSLHSTADCLYIPQFGGGGGGYWVKCRNYTYMVSMLTHPCQASGSMVLILLWARFLK